MSDKKPVIDKPKRMLDPEIKAMSNIDKILLDLEATAIPRVLAWLNDRYQPKFVDSNGEAVH